MLHAFKSTDYCCVCSTHRHPANTSPAHSLSVRADSSSQRQKKALNSHMLRDRHRICIANTRYQVHTHVRAILMRVASVGCFPGAWRRGSWHFQVASLHLQSRMDLLFVRFILYYFSFLSKRSGRRMPPPSEAPCILGTRTSIPVPGIFLEREHPASYM